MVVPLILNILLVSVPEEAYLVVFALILMKRLDLIALERDNLWRIVTMVLIVAFSSTILRVVAVLDGTTAPFYGLFLLFLLMAFMFRVKSPKGMLKLFLSLCAAFLSVFAMEIVVFTVTVPTQGYEAMELMNKPGLYGIVMSIPDRVIQVILVAMMLLKRQSFMKLGFFKVIIRNKPLAYITGALVVFNLLFLYIMFKLILYGNILSELPPVTKLLVVVLVIVFPLLNMSVLIGVINYSINKYTYTRVYVQDETRVLRVLVRSLLQQQRYGEIDMQLESYVDEIKKLK